jgi:uncharacterized RDD family membrane protein YckC
MIRAMLTCTNHPEVSQGAVTCRRCRRPFCRNCVVFLKGGPVCADCKVETVRDAQSGVAVGGLELATIGRRFGAHFLDNLLMQCVAGVGGALLGVGLGAAAGTVTETDASLAGNLASLFALVMMVVYDGLMLQLKGQTLGKMAAHVKVVSAGGADITAGQAWTRAVGKMVLGLCFGLTFFFALFSPEKLTLHDRIAKTRVVRLPA